MGIKRVIDTSLWNDSKVIDSFTPEDKYFMLYLLTNPYTTQLGIYELNKKKAAFELGYSIDTVGSLLERFETNHDMIRYSKNTNEIAIKNYLRHSIIKGGKPVEDLLIKEIGKVKDRSLISFIISNLEQYENINETVKKIILLNKNDKDNDNDNDNENENDNEVSYHVSSNAQKIDDIKHKYGEYKQIRLKDTELEKLNNDYGEIETKEAIQFLDEYIEMKGTKYKSHYLVLKKWVFEALKEQRIKNQGKGGTNERPGQTINKTTRADTIVDQAIRAGVRDFGTFEDL